MRVYYIIYWFYDKYAYYKYEVLLGLKHTSYYSYRHIAYRTLRLNYKMLQNSLLY